MDSKVGERCLMIPEPRTSPDLWEFGPAAGSDSLSAENANIIKKPLSLFGERFRFFSYVSYLWSTLYIWRISASSLVE